MKHFILLTSLALVAAVRTVAQPSFSLNVGTFVAAEGDDPYSLKSIWVPISGNNSSQDQSLRFYAGGTGTAIKISAMWEVSEIFSAGLAYKMVKWNMEEDYRSSDINSIGGQFRINFTSNTRKVVPFFQGAFYFINNSTLTQEQATKGPQTQPAFSFSASTSIGFDADLGIEFKMGKSWALLLTGGFGGTQATDPDLTVNLDYGAYYGPNSVEGVFNYAFTGGIKYYTGRGSKKRDF